MRKIAYVTCQDLPNLNPSDRLTFPYLAEQGFRVQAVAWDNTNVLWQDFDAVVIRSTWDYHTRYDEFLRWLDNLAEVNLLNPAKVVRWNSNKTYLRDLSARGIPIVPTVWLGENDDIPAILQEKGWHKAVLKPTISATAYNTHLVTLDRKPESPPGEMMLQPFMPQITEEGEWSLLFFGGIFSHAILKRPMPGDFRVQNDFGGTIERLTPPGFLVEQAARIVEGISSPLLYARVDGVNVNQIFHLMELELIEPDLYLDPDTARNFADALLKFIR